MSWEKNNLGDLFKIGSSKRVHKADWKKSGVPFYRGREITALSKFGYIDNELFISEKHYAELSEKHKTPSPEDILITAIGTIGNTYVVKKKDRFYFKDASVLWLSEGKEVDSRFIDYWFKSEDFFKQLNTGNGATVDTLSISKLKSLEISFPPISVQKQITEVLEQTLELIDKAKANVEKNIENAKDLFQSKLNEILSQSGEGWEKKSLGKICTITAGQSPEGKFYNDIREGLPFYQGKKLFGDKFLLDPNTWTSKIPKRAKPGDILISVRAPVGSLNITTQEVCIGRGLAAIHPEDSIDRDFLFYYLKCIEDSLTGSSGAVFNSINKKQIENIQILLPSLQVQKQITEVLDQTLELIDKTKANYEKELENLEELKKSILQKAFAGELTNKKDAA
jgi:type I restriction enzyme, S subunit